MSYSKKYIIYTVFWQWISLLAQIKGVFTIAELLDAVLKNTLTFGILKSTFLLLLEVIVIRYICERMSAHSSILSVLMSNVY